MRYVSTRGEASPLGFVEVTLAGLARDGGLYVPAAWPRLEAETIAGFAGRPYAEVAADVIRPFVGDAIAEHDLALEPVLAVRLQLVSGIVQRHSEIDASEHVVETPAFGTRVVDVVRDHASQAHLRGQRGECVAERWGVGII